MIPATPSFKHVFLALAVFVTLPAILHLAPFSSMLRQPSAPKKATLANSTVKKSVQVSKAERQRLLALIQAHPNVFIAKFTAIDSMGGCEPSPGGGRDLFVIPVLVSLPERILHGNDKGEMRLPMPYRCNWGPSEFGVEAYEQLAGERRILACNDDKSSCVQLFREKVFTEIQVLQVESVIAEITP